MNTVKDFRNELLKRREVELVLTAEKNPGMKDAAKNIAENFKVNEELVAVKEVGSRFGRDSFVIEAMIYDSVADKNRIEPKKKEKKKEGEAAPAAQNAPAAAGGSK